jgi:hypothetical protein
MKKFVLVLALAALCALALAAPVMGDDGGRPLSTVLTGAEEVPGPGDPDGSGIAKIKPDAEDSEICYKIKVRDIQPATAAHIHVGTSEEAGPVVVGLEPPTDGSSSGCADADRALINNILQNPSDYYVNVHNAEYPAGAVRGQL